MTLAYEPGATPVHRLDPRSKLLVQVAFVAAAFVYTTPWGLLALTALVGGILAVARTSPLGSLWEFRFALPVVVVAPLLEGATLGSPWFVVADAVGPALASYRVVLVLLLTAAYVRTTPVRESRAAIQRTVPGKAGQFLGMGAAFVFRFLPVLQDDVARIRDAQRARLGTERSIVDRIRLLTVAALNRAFERADRLALALQARCFAWNPTLPELRFGYRDGPALALAAGLLVVALNGAI
jgi:biotin transport system permease protein